MRVIATIVALCVLALNQMQPTREVPSFAAVSIPDLAPELPPEPEITPEPERSVIVEETSAASDDSTPVTPKIAASDVAPPLEYETRQVTKYRTVRVKHCNGRRCWYTNEQQPYTVTEQVPVNHFVDANKLVETADQYATPLDAAKRMLEFMWTRQSATLLDLGSGDGRMVVEWARAYGYPAIGIEMDPERVALSRAFAKSRGVSHLVRFIEGDFTAMEWPAADVIYLYQFPDVMERVAGRLKSADRVVSFAHAVPGLPMTEHGDFYTWRKPQQIKEKQPVAWYNGRAYTAPVCNKINCSMCRQIRNQLMSQ